MIDPTGDRSGQRPLSACGKWQGTEAPALRPRALRGISTILQSAATTPDVLHRWAGDLEPADQEVRDAVKNIRFRARFEPGKRYPRWCWWRSIIDSGELA